MPDTITTINYEKTNKGHGWIGWDFKNVNKKPNDIILHVNLNDQDSTLQQETIGILGTNLLYAVSIVTTQKILKTLYDNLSRDNIEIDTVRFTGPDQKMLIIGY